MDKDCCDLELRLDCTPFPADTDRHRHPHHPMMNNDVNNGNLMKQREYDDQPEKKLTLVYDGNICVSDVTELQARAILILARREMEMGRGERREASSSTLKSHPMANFPWGNASSGLSMKRSLQRFLQKRKNRIQGASPY